MAHETEAECLLRSGALYGERVLLRPAEGAPIFAGFKHGAFSLYHGDAPIAHFDLEGRWQRAYFDDLHYLRSLDGTVQTIERVREGANLVLKRRTLGYVEATDFDARIRETALELVAELDSGRLREVEPPPKARPLTGGELRCFLERIARWDSAAWFADREKYVATYGPIPFLPPDCLQAVVLQATIGTPHAWGFGGEGAATAQVRSPEEFDAHVRAVVKLMGRRVQQCRNVFLAGGDVLRLRPGDVSAYLGAIGERLLLRPAGSPRGKTEPSPDAPHLLDGAHAFLDRFDAPRPDEATLRTWSALGLARVTLGLVSGEPGIRRRARVSGSDADIQATVTELKAAGLGLGVVVLAGLGGAEHEDATVRLIEQLELGAGDIVSIVDATELARNEPTRWEGLEPVAASLQLDALKSRLLPIRSARGVKIAPYSPEKQPLG